MSPNGKRSKTRVGLASTSKTPPHPSKVVYKNKEIQKLGCITDIPSDTFQKVLLKLSVISILICKSVCKTWRGQISDPAFAKRYSTLLSGWYPLLRPWGPSRGSRTLYLIVPDDGEDSSSFDSDDEPTRKGSHDPRNIIVKLQIPMRNVEELIYNHTAEKQDTSTRDSCSDHHQYDVVNSCNGFLLLAEKHSNDPVVVCNPVTGEYMHLPKARKHEHNRRRGIDCAMGFCPLTNKYQVLRIVGEGEGEILTLGEGSWKKLEYAPNLACEKIDGFPIYFQGSVYWLCRNRKIVYYDLNDEIFYAIAPPSFRYSNCPKSSMGVLGDCLCVCEHTDGITNVFLMEDYGGMERTFGWKKIINHDMFPHVTQYPMKYSKSKGLMMFSCHTDALLYNYRSNLSSVYLMLNGTKTSFEAIPHVPSFVSLEEILVEGHHVQVLNINSRYENLRLPKESPAVFVQEKIPNSVKWCET